MPLQLGHRLTVGERLVQQGGGGISVAAAQRPGNPARSSAVIRVVIPPRPSARACCAVMGGRRPSLPVAHWTCAEMGGHVVTVVPEPDLLGVARCRRCSQSLGRGRTPTSADGERPDHPVPAGRLGLLARGAGPAPRSPAAVQPSVMRPREDERRSQGHGGVEAGLVVAERLGGAGAASRSAMAARRGAGPDSVGVVRPSREDGRARVPSARVDRGPATVQRAICSMLTRGVERTRRARARPPPAAAIERRGRAHVSGADGASSATLRVRLRAAAALSSMAAASSPTAASRARPAPRAGLVGGQVAAPPAGNSSSGLAGGRTARRPRPPRPAACRWASRVAARRCS